MGLRMKIFNIMGGSLKNPIFRGGGGLGGGRKTNIYRGFSKKVGTWTVSKFEGWGRGVGKEEGGGCF